VNKRLNSTQRPYTNNNIDELKLAYAESLKTIKIISDELEKQKILFSNLFNLAPDPYLILNGDGSINQVNIMGTSLFGMSSESMLGEKLSKFVVLNNKRDLEIFLDRLASRQGVDRVELAFERPDNTILHARVDGTSYKENGRVTYSLFIKKLPETVQTTYSTKQTKEKLERLLEASHAGTWELDIDTMRFYLVVSDKIQCPIPILGFDGRYRTFINYIHPDDRKKVEAGFRQSIDSGLPIDLICRFPTDDGGICYGRIKGQFLHSATHSKSLAGIIMNVTEQIIAEKREMELKDDQRRLISMATIQAGENERRSISDMLHDSVNQLLYAVKLKLDVLKPEFKNSGSLIEIDQLVDQAINDVRNISFALAPSILVEFGLPATLSELANRLSSAKMQIKTACFRNVERPALALELNIFRIIQELLNNCIKHSGATLIDIKLTLSREIAIEVNDNGKGFSDPLQTINPSGSGLSSIKNRLTLYNGTLKIDSVTGEGTKIFITINS
jgi:PAS domain S-box-containing protein